MQRDCWIPGGSRERGLGGLWCALTPFSLLPQAPSTPRMIGGAPRAPQQPRVSGAPPSRHANPQPCTIFWFPVFHQRVMGSEAWGGGGAQLWGGTTWGGGGGAQPGGPTCRVLEAGGLLRWVTPATAGCVWGSGRVGWGGADTWAPVSGGKGLPWVGRGPVYGGGAFGGLGAAGTAGRGSSSRRRRAATAHLLFSCVSGVGPKRRPGGPPRTLGPPPPPPGVHVHREEGATVAAGTGEPAVSMATGLRFAGKKR